MEKEPQPDSLSTVTVKEYPPSEYSHSDIPPPYRRPKQATAVQVARIAAYTVVAVAFIFGAFSLASSYVQANAYKEQLQREIELQQQFSQPEALVQEEPLSAQQSQAALKQVNEPNLKTDEDVNNKIQKNDETNKKDDDVAESNENSLSSDEDSSDEDDDADDEDRLQIKLPMHLNLDDIAAALMEKNQKTRMNCFVEKKRADEVIDHKPKTVSLPFGLNLTTDPRYEHVTGERMVIICESGTEQRHGSSQEEMMVQPIIIPLPHFAPQQSVPQQPRPVPQQQQQRPEMIPPFIQQIIQAHRLGLMRPPQPPQERPEMHFHQESAQPHMRVEMFQRAEQRPEVVQIRGPEIIQIRAEARPEMRPEIRSEMRPEIRAEFRPDFRPEIRAEFRPEMRPEIRAEFRPEIRAEIMQQRPEIFQLRPEMILQHRQEVMAQHRPEMMLQHRQEVMSQHRPEIMAQHRPEMMMQHRPEIMIRPEVMFQHRPEAMIQQRPEVMIQQQRPEPIVQHRPEIMLQHHQMLQQPQQEPQQIMHAVPQPHTVQQPPMPPQQQAVPEAVIAQHAQSLSIPEEILSQINRLPHQDVIAVSVTSDNGEEENSQQEQEHVARVVQQVRQAEAAVAAQQQQEQQEQEQQTVVAATDAPEGRQAFSRDLPVHIPMPLMQQIQQEEAREAKGHEPRPHYVQPRSIRNL